MPFSLFSLFYFSITLAFLLYASFTDLKERIVSNRLNYSMLAVGLLLHLLQALLENNRQIFYLTIACVIATFLGSFLLWKLGVWAGGDVKLFTALAALVPLNPAVIPQALGYAQGLFAPLDLPVFPLTLFIFSIFSMFPLGLGIGVKGILKSKKLKEKLAGELKIVFSSALFFSFAIAGFEALFLKFNISLWLVFIPLLILAFLHERVRVFASVAVFALAFYLVNAFSVLEAFVWSLVSLALIGFFLKLFFFTRREVFIIEKKISKLEEGEIVAESVLVDKGKVKRFEGIGFAETFKYLKNNNLAGLLKALKPEGRMIADRHSAAGLTLEELKELKKLARLGKTRDAIKVKLSTAFVPGVLVAFLILSFIVDVFWRVLF